MIFLLLRNEKGFMGFDKTNLVRVFHVLGFTGGDVLISPRENQHFSLSIFLTIYEELSSSHLLITGQCAAPSGIFREGDKKTVINSTSFIRR